MAGLVLLFAVLCLIYWTVPNGRLPWRAIWPGALGATLAIGIVDYAFPAYLSSISTIARFGTTFVFVLIVLIWFYVLAIIILGGATINAMRFEIHETGVLRAGEQEPEILGMVPVMAARKQSSPLLPDRRRASGGAPGGAGAARIDLAEGVGERRREPRRGGGDQRTASSTW